MKQMARLSQLLFSRSTMADKVLSRKATNIREFSQLCNLISRASISTTTRSTSTDGSSLYGPRVNFSIFKGKAALSMLPILPKLRKIDSGVEIERRGCIMLCFWPAVPGQQRKYDWEKRQRFSLSAVEVGSLISLGPSESCEFFHDPSMKTSLAGQVRKNLSVSPSNESGDYFFNLNVTNNISKTTDRFSLPVTKAEFAVMRSGFSFVLPYILGWDHVTNPLASSESQQPTLRRGASQNDAQLPPSPELEWSR